MLETFTPAVCGSRKRQIVAQALFAVAAVAAAARARPRARVRREPRSAPAQAVLAAAALARWLAAAAREPGSCVSRFPQARRQVPDRWRFELPLPVWATGYGAGLGAGFFTFQPVSTFWVACAGALALARPAAGSALPLPLRRRPRRDGRLAAAAGGGPHGRRRAADPPPRRTPSGQRRRAGRLCRPARRWRRPPAGRPWSSARRSTRPSAAAWRSRRRRQATWSCGLLRAGCRLPERVPAGALGRVPRLRRRPADPRGSLAGRHRGRPYQRRSVSRPALDWPNLAFVRVRATQAPASCGTS